MPAPPTSSAMLAFGVAVHHLVIWRSSVVASRTPFLVSGTFSPGLQGKMGHPRRAWASAALSISLLAAMGLPSRARMLPR